MEGAAQVLRLWLLAVVTAAGLSIAACTTTSTVSDDPTVEVDEDEPVDEPPREPDEPIDDSLNDDEPATDEPAKPQWVCSYSPTYDYDWHNDVVCTNGTEQQRPYLREWDSYITESEIMESAREYERQLNGG